MYLLDTSVVSNFLDERRYYPQLTTRILSQPPEQIFISIITVAELKIVSIAVFIIIYI